MSKVFFPPHLPPTPRFSQVTCIVTLSVLYSIDKRGPIYTVDWNPNSNEFCVIYGCIFSVIFLFIRTAASLCLSWDSTFRPQEVIILPKCAPIFDFFTAILCVESTNIYHCVDQSKLAIEHRMKFCISSMKLDILQVHSPADHSVWWDRSCGMNFLMNLNDTPAFTYLGNT